MLHITFFVACIVAFTCSVSGEPKCEGYSTEKCNTMVQMGVATAYINGIKRVEDFVEPMQVQFKKAIANVSNHYVILQVLPKHVLIVDVTYSENDRVVVHYLVVNPSGSIVLPVAFRSHELYLMCKLNDDKIDKILDYSIVPIEPESDYKLAIPPWAIAISCYFGIVAVFYISYTVYQSNQKFKKMEEKIENYEMQSSMEKGHNLRLQIDSRGNDVADHVDGPNEKGTQVRQHQIRSETSMIEVEVESPVSKLGENDEIPPPYASDNSSSAGSSTGSGNTSPEAVATEKSRDDKTTVQSEAAPVSANNKQERPIPQETANRTMADDKQISVEAVKEDDLPEPPPTSLEQENTETLPEEESLPLPPQPDKLNDITGLTHGEQEATAALDGIVNNGFQDHNDDVTIL